MLLGVVLVHCGHVNGGQRLHSFGMLRGSIGEFDGDGGGGILGGVLLGHDSVSFAGFAVA
jgi:hypothetical protein